jgi:hypothetical protein
MSRLSLAHDCSYGFRSDVETFERPAGRPARVGVGVHSMVELARNGTVKALAEEPDIVAEAEAIFNGPLKAYVADGGWTHCEIGLRYDAENDVCADGPRRGEDGYGEVGAMVLPGTLDLLRIDGKRGKLRDVKSGKPPSDAEQLYGQAVAAARRFGLEEVEIGYARALKTKLQELNVEVLDAERLDVEAGRIARVLRRLPTAEPVPGDAYCWRCNARPACPAFGAAKAEHQMVALEEGGFFA